MSIFKKKEKEDKLPRLPELPPLEFPSYEPQIERKGEQKREDSSQRKSYSPSIVASDRYGQDMPLRKTNLVEDKPIFIKMEKYKDAINDLENIKKTIKEAEVILSELERIKEEEEREIENWKIEIEKIKTRLMDVDRKLFDEV